MNEVKQREQLHKLLDIVLDGNGFESRTREKTGTLPSLFFDFSGHVNNLSIRMYADGWHEGAEWKDFDFYLDYDISDERIDTFRAAVNDALECKNPSDVLSRDIEQKEKRLEESKKEITRMKKELRKMKKKEGIA